jgi:hypothetical protein
MSLICYILCKIRADVFNRILLNPCLFEYFYGIILSLIPKFANECVIEFYIRSMSGVTR